MENEREINSNAMVNSKAIKGIEFEIDQIERGKAREMLEIKNKDEALEYFSNLDWIENIPEAVAVQKEYIKDTEEIKDRLMEGFESALENGEALQAINIMDEFGLVYDSEASKRIKSKALEGFDNSLKSGNISSAVIIKAMFSLNDEEVKEIAWRNLDNFKGIKELEEINDNFLHDSGLFSKIQEKIISEEQKKEFPENKELREKAIEAFNYNLSKGNIIDALRIREYLFPDEVLVGNSEFKDDAIKGIKECLAGGKIAESSYIKKLFGIDLEDIKEDVENSYKEVLKEGEVLQALSIREEFGLKDDELTAEAAKIGFGKKILEEAEGAGKEETDPSKAIIKNMFTLTDEDIRMIAQKIYDDLIIKIEKEEIEKAIRIKEKYLKEE